MILYDFNITAVGCIIAISSPVCEVYGLRYFKIDEIIF